MKRPHAEMRSDPNFPGLQVCGRGCADQKDPYRLPARQTERINLRFPRPDVSVATNPNNLTVGGYSGAILSVGESGGIVQNDGNMEGIEVTPSSN
jgi:photosystem II stability/assembly factor-like uncharacterized protein